jgi:hypothetical protein
MALTDKSNRPKLPPSALGRLSRKKVPVPKGAPTIDELVVAFLRCHDVNAQPASFKQGSRLTTALLAGTGSIDAAGDYALVSGQASSHKAQEWTSWKQWALAHPEWKLFKEERLEQWNCRREKALQWNKAVDQWLETPESIAEQWVHFERARKTNKLVAVTALAMLAVTAVATAINPELGGLVVRGFNGQSSPPKPAPAGQKSAAEVQDEFKKCVMDVYASRGDPAICNKNSKPAPMTREDRAALRQIQEMCAQEVTAKGEDPSGCFN